MVEKYPGTPETPWMVTHDGIMWHVARPNQTALCSRKIQLFRQNARRGGDANYGDRLCKRCTEMLGRQQR